MTDPRSIRAPARIIGNNLIDQGSGPVVRVSRSLILPTFAGVGPIKIYSLLRR